ncbi:MAG: STAS domain-containing protein [Candidatus Doudnabacteria bacterium]|nr:STAS domain-containing protein [Candidatus Doudnabacteria bacterium]
MLKIGSERLNGVYSLTVSGRLDSSTGDELEQVVQSLPAEDKRLILIDLTGVTHMDTKGLGQIAFSQRDIQKAAGRACWIVSPKQTQVMGKLTSSGIIAMLELCDSVIDGYKMLIADL